MNRDYALRIAGLLMKIDRIDDACNRLDRQDADKFGSRRMGWDMSSELGPLLSAEAARRIRALMRDDYLASKAAALAELESLGVEMGEPAKEAHRELTEEDGEPQRLSHQHLGETSCP